MLFQILNFFLQNMSFLGSYSNEMFPPPLSSKEEKMYIEKMQACDKEARCKLIEHNLRLVAHIVKKFDTNNNDIDDLIGIGTVGLIKGIDTLISQKTEIPVYIADRPLDCVANGTGKTIEDMDKLRTALIRNKRR